MGELINIWHQNKIIFILCFFSED